MVTDNWPVEFLYISHRLTRKIVQQHEVAERQPNFAVSIPTPLGSISGSRRLPDYNNPYDLARRATSAVVNMTGTLDAAVAGEYLRTTLDFACCEFPVLDGLFDVAALFADQTTPNHGRVFVALFGSIRNYIGYQPTEDATSGWTPSDVRGIYGLLAESLEERDRKPMREEVEADLALPSEWRFHIARTLSNHISARFQREHLEVLAKKHHHEAGVEIGGVLYDNAFLGAAVWAATLPRRIPRLHRRRWIHGRAGRGR